jgi:hypothetical protein
MGFLFSKMNIIYFSNFIKYNSVVHFCVLPGVFILFSHGLGDSGELFIPLSSVSSFCSTSGTRPVTLVTYLMEGYFTSIWLTNAIATAFD